MWASLRWTAGRAACWRTAAAPVPSPPSQGTRRRHGPLWSCCSPGGRIRPRALTPWRAQRASPRSWAQGSGISQRSRRIPTKHWKTENSSCGTESLNGAPPINQLRSVAGILLYAPPGGGGAHMRPAGFLHHRPGRPPDILHRRTGGGELFQRPEKRRGRGCPHPEPGVGVPGGAGVTPASR